MHKTQDSQHSHASQVCLTSVCSGIDQTATPPLILQIRPGNMYILAGNAENLDFQITPNGEVI